MKKKFIYMAVVLSSLVAFAAVVVATPLVRVTGVANAAVLGPALDEPTDGAQLSNLGPTLKWAYPDGSQWFHIQVIPYNNQGAGVDLIIGDSSMVRAAQYQVREPDFGSISPNYVMLPGMTYTWRVRTATVTTVPREGEWSEWAGRSFRTVSKSGATILLSSPSFGTKVSSFTPTLMWGNTDRAVFFYEIQVSRDPNFGTGIGSPFLYWELMHGGQTSPPNSYSIPSRYSLENDATYYWRVRPRVQGDAVPADWSNAYLFTTPALQ